MTHDERSIDSAREAPVTLVALWLAIAGSLLEVVVLFVRKRRDPLMPLGADFAWMAPVALLALVGAITALAAVAGRAWRPLRALGLFVSASLVFLDLLMLIPGLAHYAAAVLAAGAAVQVVRFAQAGGRRWGGALRATAILMAALLVVLAGWIRLTWQPASDGTPAAAAPASGAPNVLLITLDTVRAANLSAYGYGRGTTPEIDRFASRGVIFDTALATASWTLPSHASLFTGRWPHELSADHTTPLDGRDRTLAEFFRDRGYATGGFVANLKYCGSGSGLGRGFDVYEDYPLSLGEVAASSTIVRNVADNFRLRRFIENDQHLNRVSNADINERLFSWLDSQGDRPFFAFLNYFDAHEPYLPPAPFDRQFGSGRADGRHSPLHHWLWNPAVGHAPLAPAVVQEEADAYDNTLAYLDHGVGALLDELDRRGVLDRTIVVITADHGEEFAEHGVFEHGYSLYRPSVQVPLIVVAPGVPAAARVGTPVSLRDIAATIVALAAPGTSGAFPGFSLAPLWSGAAGAPAAATSPVFAEVNPSPGQPDWFPSSLGPMKSLVAGGLRYIRNGDGREELYDFDADPWERKDLAGEPDRQAALAAARAALDRLIASGGR